MKVFLKILFTNIFLLSTVLGWGKTGHRITGEIAEKYLTKNAKIQIKKLIGHHDISRMANWADEIKSDPSWKKANDWHYCTIPDSEKYEFQEKNGKAVEKVNEFHQIALSKGATNEGLPGPRHDENYYAYIRDLDGNKICAFASISKTKIK